MSSRKPSRRGVPFALWSYRFPTVLVHSGLYNFAVRKIFHNGPYARLGKTEKICSLVAPAENVLESRCSIDRPELATQTVQEALQVR
jgi:hypothetical protein